MIPEVSPVFCPRYFFDRLRRPGLIIESRWASNYSQLDGEELSGFPSISDCISLLVLGVSPDWKKNSESPESMANPLASVAKGWIGEKKYLEVSDLIRALTTETRASVPSLNLEFDIGFQVRHYLRIRAKLIELQSEWGNVLEGDIWCVGDYTDKSKAIAGAQDARKGYRGIADAALMQIGALDQVLANLLGLTPPELS